MKYIAEIAGQVYEIEILNERWVSIDGEGHEISFGSIQQRLTYSLLVDGKSFEVNIYQENGCWEVLLRGNNYFVDVIDERERRLRQTAGKSRLVQEKFYLQAPMPGLVIDVPVEEGQKVDEGDVLLILESMKMQNELTSPRKGKITRIIVGVQENVSRKQKLLIVE